MKKALFAIIGCLALSAFTAGAATEGQTITINDEVVEGKTVKQILFDQEKVTVVFDDGTTADDIVALNLLTGVSGASKVGYYSTAMEITGNLLTVRGLSGVDRLRVYDVMGREAINVAAPAGDVAIIDISSLSSGVYMLGAGEKIIKFYKK